MPWDSSGRAVELPSFEMFENNLTPHCARYDETNSHANDNPQTYVLQEL